MIRLLLTVLLLVSGPAGLAVAAEPADSPSGSPGPGFHYFRIGTGNSSGGYFIAGSLIASAITNPPGTRACERGGSCGVPGLIGVTQATTGGLDNLTLLQAGAIEAALVQADSAAAAYLGSNRHETKPPFSDLRVLATLFTESVQIAVRADGPIVSVGDLRGRMVSVGEAGSAIAADARLMLGELGLSERAYQPLPLRPGLSVDRLIEGSLDALFIVGATPFAAISDAARRIPIRLLALSPDQTRLLSHNHPLFRETTVPAETYPGVAATPTLGVDALLVVRASLDPELVFGIASALDQPATRRAFAARFANSKVLDQPAASQPVPLHEGSQRFYRSLTAH